MTENNQVNATEVVSNGVFGSAGNITYNAMDTSSGFCAIDVAGGGGGGSTGMFSEGSGVGGGGSTGMCGNGVTSLYVGTPWDFWQNYYYPQIIYESYPVYLKERANDNGKKAFEVLKIFMDKKIIKFEKVSEFIEAMDTLIKIL